MSISRMIDVVTSEVKQKLREYCKNVDDSELSPDLMLKLSDALQKSLSAGGRAGYRNFLESYDEQEESVCKNGVPLFWKMKSSKNYLTPFGVIDVERNVYQSHEGRDSQIPLDEKWCMVGEFATCEVRESILWSVAYLTPRETATMLKKCALFHPSPTAIQNIVNDSGDWLEENRKKILATIRVEDKIPETTRVMVASLDGANVLLKEPGQKRGRPLERPQAKVKKECSTCYKNALVGSISFYGTKPEDGEEPDRLSSRYMARMPEANGVTLKHDWEFELNDVEKQLLPDTTKVVLVDGARGLWKYIDDNSRFDNYEKLLDYYHMTEHLSGAGEALFGKQSEEGKTWYKKWKSKLLEDDNGVDGLLRSMNYYEKENHLSKKRTKKLKTQVTFFKNNRHRMKYCAFIQRGLPIGSGPVEAACKSLVKFRLCRSGMRWTRPGGQDILTLRAIEKSQQWDFFWQAYKSLKFYTSKQKHKMVA